MGLLSSFSTIRKEGKHKSLKLTSNVCCTRVNLSLTVAIKQQLAFCHRLACNQSILSDKLKVGPGNFTNLRDVFDFSALSKPLPKAVADESEFIFVPKWVEYKGSVFKPQMLLLVGFHPEFQYPVFGQIRIVLTHENQPLFVCSVLHTIGYFSHVRGFQVEEKSDNAAEWVLADDLKDPLPLSLYSMKTGEKIVLPKHCMY